MDSPLLHGHQTGTGLDLITNRLFFIIPLTPQQIDFLNTPLFTPGPFYVNMWSLTHTLFGMIWGIAEKYLPNIFSVQNFIIFHTIFELWELWTGGYLDGPRTLDFREVLDIMMDTLFGLLGIYLVRKVSYV